VTSASTATASELLVLPSRLAGAGRTAGALVTPTAPLAEVIRAAGQSPRVHAAMQPYIQAGLTRGLSAAEQQEMARQLLSAGGTRSSLAPESLCVPNQDAAFQLMDQYMAAARLRGECCVRAVRRVQDVLALNRGPAEPLTYVVMGATGDLTARLLTPAFLGMQSKGALHDKTVFLAVGKDEMTTQAFRDVLRKAAGEHAKGVDAEVVEAFLSRVEYHAASLKYERGSGIEASAYPALSTKLDELAAAGAGENAMFYLALPPSLVPGTIYGLDEAVSKSPWAMTWRQPRSWPTTSSAPWANRRFSSITTWASRSSRTSLPCASEPGVSRA
jgi:hypothetical protein